MKFDIKFKLNQLRDMLFVPVGTSGIMMFWTIDQILHTKGGLKAIAFCSDDDKKFLLEEGTILEKDVIPITGPGTAGDRNKAEIAYLNARDLIVDALGRKIPFSSALILSFTGGGTGRCGELFIEDILKGSKDNPGFPKIVVVLKVPAHVQHPFKGRNTNDSLKNYKELFKKCEDEEKLVNIIFSDGISLEQVPPGLKEDLTRRHIRWPDTTNVPIGDWCGVVLNAHSQPTTNVSDFFRAATQKPAKKQSSYGPFSAALIARSVVGKREDLIGREKRKEEVDKILSEARSGAKKDLNGLINNLTTVIDVTTLKDVSFSVKETAGIYGCLWAPSVDDPTVQNQEIMNFERALKSQLKKMGATVETYAPLFPIYQDDASTMDILGVIRGVKFSFGEGEGIVDSENL